MEFDSFNVIYDWMLHRLINPIPTYNGGVNYPDTCFIYNDPEELKRFLKSCNK